MLSAITDTQIQYLNINIHKRARTYAKKDTNF
jgi:hypothetical protein